MTQNTGETSPEVAALAARLMHHDDPDVRRVAASALRQVEGDEPAPPAPAPEPVSATDVFRAETGFGPEDITRMSREAEAATLRRKIAAREGQPGFEQNVVAMKARLAELETPHEVP